MMFFILCLVAVGCKEKPSVKTFPPHLMVNYTARNAGAFFPCGCRIPLGGLSRRAGALAAETAYPMITLDAGSFAGGNTAYARFSAGWILKAYALMGYTAINLGTEEAVQSVGQIRDWDSSAQGILISANLQDDEGLPVTRKYLIREVGGIRIGITGYTSAENRPSEAAEMPKVVPPGPALKEVMDKFKSENVDFVVLLADAPSTSLEEVLGIITGVDLVIQGQEFNSGQKASSQLLDSGTRLVRMGGEGKYLGRMRLDFDPMGAVIGEEVWRVDLDNTTPSASEISTLLTEFKIELRKRREEFIGDPANPFQRSQSPEFVDILVGYTGDGFCLKCHPVYDLEQNTVGHGQTWSRLDESQRTNPECLVCHTTGYGLPTGLKDPDKESNLRGIGCEACHGAGAQHVREQTAIKHGIDPASIIPPEDIPGLPPFSRQVPKEICLRCHTEKWSPGFDYDTWVLRVNHASAKKRPAEFDPVTGERKSPDIPEDAQLPSDE